MARKSIKIKENPYRALNTHKRSGKTYSDVIIRLVHDNEVHCTKDKKTK
jgi:predicted CopG family antitoxin